MHTIWLPLADMMPISDSYPASESYRIACDGDDRDIPRAEFDSWATSFYQARISQEDRDSKVDQTSELIERNLILLGCTAIEDKLQDKVPQSISSLMQAGIKLWVLTGEQSASYSAVGIRAVR